MIDMRDLIPKAILTTAMGLALAGGVHKEAGRYILNDPYKNMTAKQAVRNIDSWKGAENYIMRHMKYSFDSSNYGFEDFDAPFDEIHKRGKDDCDGGATAGAALLSDNPRYKVTHMTLNGRIDSEGTAGQLLGKIGMSGNHAVTLVYDTKTKKYGSLGINSVDNIEPTLDSPESVFKRINRWFLLQFRDFELGEYDATSLLHGKSGFEKYNEWTRKEKKNGSLGHSYTALEKPHSPGKWIIIEGELPNEFGGRAESWKPIMDSYQSYSVLDVEKFFNEACAKNPTDKMSMLSYFDKDIFERMQKNEIDFK